MFRSCHWVSHPVQAGDPSQRWRAPDDDDGKQQIERRVRDPESDLKCPNLRTTVSTMFGLSCTGPILGHKAVLRSGLDRDDQKQSNTRGERTSDPSRNKRLMASTTSH